MTDVLGAVLVGGKSTRMGRDKALLEIDGVRLVDRVATVLAAAGCARVVAIGPGSLAGENEHIDDLHPGEGPLGGILTAMSVATPVLVIACDLPAIDAGSVAELLRAADTDGAVHDVVMARTDRLEPLSAVWFERSKTHLQAAFDGGERAVHRAMAGLAVQPVDVPSASLRNVNRPEDLGK